MSSSSTTYHALHRALLSAQWRRSSSQHLVIQQNNRLWTSPPNYSIRSSSRDDQILQCHSRRSSPFFFCSKDGGSTSSHLYSKTIHFFDTHKSSSYDPQLGQLVRRKPVICTPYSDSTMHLSISFDNNNHFPSTRAPFSPETDSKSVINDDDSQ